MAVSNLTDEDVRDIVRLSKDEKIGDRVSIPVFVFVFSICFEWACQDFLLLKANLGPLCMPHPGIGPLL